MIKPTPNPPETVSVSPYECIDSKKLHEAADRALDHYFCPPGSTPPPRKNRGMYAVTADNKNEELLIDASETLLRLKPLRRTSPVCCRRRSVGRCWGLRS
jgi:hypothetical protein